MCLRKRRHELPGWPKTFVMLGRRKPGHVWLSPRKLEALYPHAEAYFDSLLYGLPHLLAAGPWDDLAVVEGEKDADNLTAAGLPALSHWQGGTGWTREQAARWSGFRGGVILVADRDAAGARCALQTRSLLLGAGVIASRLRVVLPVTGKDASDHLAAGHDPVDFVPADLDSLAVLAATAPPPGRGGAYRAGRAL
ncbi:hypothetical protein SAMN06264364_120102 [Quadrisphaera granulorum]|uniref:Toprim domain-containing protein n=1 Tax=Quadrisphaera granulorum TaxID=317664 RepID=A0A316A2K3_9ACTN|nr:hypothetical protein [Quadrisphaera granulorum]PWJ51823.1 hypothetical protein BXY45_120102 [Quadrisphaera granulorum]SZE97770.1 hypothetical protein SAMN06264364_120102 [Quadrisphaera granulorum]